MTVLLGLATWRVSKLLADEDGPAGILAKFRGFIGVYYDDYSNKKGKNTLAELFTCVWCLSVWVGLIMSFFSPTSTNIIDYFITALGLSAVAIIVDSVTK